ncbi:DUF5074 domain-containing protein [Fibrella sp. HMF5405]|uniref:DUF5074 domain-containing protein n=1 Tax=Fibrella forsythiae TaxID=2817061 RepID=A0ABS3JBQ9_9BACT|nr:DUF5074 domain-containing protein [Fibrella forsythiae]
MLSASAAAFTVATLLTACNSNTDPTPTGPYTNGIFVLNAGNFLDNNGSLSWMTRNGKTAETDLFQTRNRRPLTGGVRGYVEAGNRGLILVDNSSTGLDKVEIVTTDSLKSVKTLASPDIENPRYAARINDTKVYVTCWGTTGGTNFYGAAGYVAVIDLTTNTVTKKIPVQRGAEGITIVGNEAYIGGVGGDKLVQIMDTQTDAIKTSLSVASSISKLLPDANNKLWGFSGKNVVRIDPTSKTIEATILVGTDTRKSPSNLTASADKRSFYFMYTFYDQADNFNQKGEMYRFNITDATISTATPTVNRLFSGLGLDPSANVLYAGFSPSYKQAGYVFRYQPTGQLIDSVRVEIAPSDFYFK